jgi:hypothetical protein
MKARHAQVLAGIDRPEAQVMIPGSGLYLRERDGVPLEEEGPVGQAAGRVEEDGDD